MWSVVRGSHKDLGHLGLNPHSTLKLFQVTALHESPFHQCLNRYNFQNRSKTFPLWGSSLKLMWCRLNIIGCFLSLVCLFPCIFHSIYLPWIFWPGRDRNWSNGINKSRLFSFSASGFAMSWARPVFHQPTEATLRVFVLKTVPMKAVRLLLRQ